MRAMLVLAIGLAAAPAAAAPFDRDPAWWIETGPSYGQSIGPADRAHLPAMRLAAQRAVSARLAIAAELDLPMFPTLTDGGLFAGLGLSLASPLTAPEVVEGGDLVEEGRRVRSRLELVLRSTAGWASIYNDVSEGPGSSGIYARALAGLRWRLDPDRGWLTSLGLGLYPSAAAVNIDGGWRLDLELAFLVSVGLSDTP